MKVWPLLLAAFLLPGAAMARERVHYECEIRRSDAGGTLQVNWQMTPAGEGAPTDAFWMTAPLEAATMSMSWNITNGAGPPPDDNPVYVTHWYTRGSRRVELWRDPASPPLVGPYDRRRWQATIRQPLATLRAFVPAGQTIEVRAVNRAGRVLGTGRVDPAALASPIALGAGLQQEIDAVRRDYRTRCELRDPSMDVVFAH